MSAHRVSVSRLNDSRPVGLILSPLVIRNTEAKVINHMICSNLGEHAELILPSITPLHEGLEGHAQTKRLLFATTGHKAITAIYRRVAAAAGAASTPPPQKFPSHWTRQADRGRSYSSSCCCCSSSSHLLACVATFPFVNTAFHHSIPLQS